MSKKVLNYAGRRPMLLALIMATLTLGLLFSGWLTPTPGRAQSGGGDPSPSDETPCVEYGPHWGPWQKDSCPSLNNTPSVSPADECVGTMPTVTVPTYSPGSKHQDGTNDCNNNVDKNYGSITFTAGTVYWLPAPPSPVTDDYSQTAYVDVTSSDPSLCASLTKVSIGSCTWHINPNVGCTPTAPSNEYHVALIQGGRRDDTITNITYGVFDTYYDVMALSLVVGTTYTDFTYGDKQDWGPTSCGPSTPLPDHTTLPEDDWKVSLDIPVGVGICIGIEHEHVNANPLFPIFKDAVSPPASYTREYGSTWMRKSTPTPPTAVGYYILNRYLTDWEHVLGPTTIEVNGPCSFVNPSSDSYKDLIGSATCTVKCCPNN